MEMEPSHTGSDCKDILQVTFRNHHNAYTTEQNKDRVKIIKLSSDSSNFVYKLCEMVFSGLVLHYFFWFIPLFVYFYIPYWLGYPLVSLVSIAYYTTSYLKADELKYGRQWDGIRNSKLWRFWQKYLELEVVREYRLEPGRKYIFAHYPHGILVLSRIGVFGGIFETLFPGIEVRALSATPLYTLPGCREMCLWLGGVRADKPCAENILRKSNMSLLIYAGGSAEIFHTDKNSKETVILARKGFIRLALETGADIVPSLGFGEKYAYETYNFPDFIRNFFIQRFKLPVIMFWGRFYSLVPFKLKSGLSIIYGKPIRIPNVVNNPSNEVIDQISQQYYAELQSLFNRYKDKYDYTADERLVIKYKFT